MAWQWAVILIILLVLAVYFDFLRLFYLVRKTIFYYKRSKCFQKLQKNAKTRVLFLGDSTGFGFALNDVAKSVAGRFSKDFPDAEIVNRSIPGLLASGLSKRLKSGKLILKNERKYDLIVIQIAGIDIMRFSKIENTERNLNAIFMTAKTALKKEGRIVFLPPGNIGLAPIFPPLLRFIYTRRTRKFRKMFTSVSKKNNVIFVDLFQERKDDFSLKDVKRYYINDYLHPSEEAYAFWYKKMREVLHDNKVKLN